MNGIMSKTDEHVGPSSCDVCGAWPARQTERGQRCHLCESREWEAEHPVPLPGNPEMLKDLAAAGYAPAIQALGTRKPHQPSWEDQRIEALETMLTTKAGICPDCGEEFSHQFDEPFADCRCGTCEWVGDGNGGGLPVIAVLRREIAHLKAENQRLQEQSDRVVAGDQEYLEKLAEAAAKRAVKELWDSPLEIPVMPPISTWVAAPSVVPDTESSSPTTAERVATVLAKIKGGGVRRVMASTQHGMGFLLVDESQNAEDIGGIVFRDDQMNHAMRALLADEVNKILAERNDKAKEEQP